MKMISTGLSGRVWLLLLATLFTTQTWAFSNGITGRSGQSGSTCNACHAGADFNSSIAISGSTQVDPNSANNYTITLTHTAAFAGFNLSVSDGNLTVTDSGTKLASSELVHNSPKTASSGRTEWSFQWTAPSDSGSNTFWVCGNPVDGNGSTSGDESNTPCTTLSVSVVSNSPPTANNDSASVDEDAGVEIDVTANDSDSDGTLDKTTVSIISNVSNGTTSVNGTTGVVTYTPTANFFGNDSFTYTINDNEGATSNTATVSITVNSVNDAPTANNDSVSTDEDTSVTISILSNDSDSDGSLSNGSISIVQTTSNGSTSINTADGTVTYTPTANFSGSDSFSYTVQDNEGASSNTATVSITVNAVNDAPVANNDSASTDEDNAVTVNVLSNDSDVDSTLDTATLAVADSPSNGSANAANGSITYTPNSNFNGTDSFTYTVNDTSGATSNTATVTVTVNSVNDAPIAADDVVTTAEDTAVTISILSNDSDIDGNLVNTSIALVVGVSNGSTSIDTSAGTVTYTPSSGFNGSDSFSYTVNDNEGATSNTATVNITVTEVNDSPVASNDSATTDEDNPVTINVVANDSDSDGTIDNSTVAIVSSPSNGTTSISDGSVTYTPSANFNGNDSFTYTVNDDKGATSNTATVSITVNSVNDAPVAVDDSATTEINEAITIAVLGNDSDIDGTLDLATVTLLSNPSNGSASVNTADGTVTYTPTTDFNGSDTFTYSVNDNEGTASNSATVSITVRKNEAPVAANDNATTDEDNAVVISVLSNDSDDLAIDVSSVAVVDAPSMGSATANSDGTITYTPQANANGNDSFTYTVNDNQGATSNTAMVNLTINAVNDAPVFTSDPVTTVTQNHNYEYRVTTSDVEDDTVSLQLTTDQSWLSLSDNVVGGVPPLDAIGSHNITITASDGSDSTVQSYTLTVTPRTDADIAVIVSFSPTPATTNESVTLTFTVTNNGPADADNVKLTGQLQGTVDGVLSNGPCALGSECTIDSLALNQSTDISFSLSVSQATDLFATAEVIFAEDLTAGNNKAVAATSVASAYTTSTAADGGANSRAVVTGDINGDGFADAVFINGNAENDQIFVNNGSGQLSLMATLSDGLDGAAGALFDVDGDNDLDLIVANCSGHANQLYLNDNGNFTLQQSLGTADSRGVAVADINGDGMPDLMFANADGANTIYTKGEDGSYNLMASLQIADGANHSLAVAAADFNSDGLTDIVFANSDGTNALYFNMTTQSDMIEFDAPVSMGMDNTMGIALLDANSDGITDLIFANSSASGSQQAPANQLFVSTGDKGFNDVIDIGMVNTHKITSGDFNGDGHTDLFFINAHGSHQLYTGNGAASFNLNARGYRNPNAVSAAVADLDNDGDQDLLYADSRNKQGSMLLNDGSGEMDSPMVDTMVTLQAPDVVNAGEVFTLTANATNNTAAIEAQNSILVITLLGDFEITSELPVHCSLADILLSCVLGSLVQGTEQSVAVSGRLADTGLAFLSAALLSSTNELDESNNAATTMILINGAPVANNDNATVQTGNSVTIDVLANDTDEGTLGGVAIVDAPSNGSATVNDNGSIDYTPNSGFTGSDSFTYTVMDEHQVTSNTATVSITVTAVPEPPSPPSSSGGGGGSSDLLVLLGLAFILMGRVKTALWRNR